jgi:hypothetical protein
MAVHVHSGLGHVRGVHNADRAGTKNIASTRRFIISDRKKEVPPVYRLISDRDEPSVQRFGGGKGVELEADCDAIGRVH